MYFQIRQNNSRGLYKGPAIIVAVMASDIEEAKKKMTEVGVYFNTYRENDCPCCGLRWEEWAIDEVDEEEAFSGCESWDIDRAKREGLQYAKFIYI